MDPEQKTAKLSMGQRPTNDIKLNDRKLFIRFSLFCFFIIRIFCSNYARVLRHTSPFYYLPAIRYEYTKRCS